MSEQSAPTMRAAMDAAREIIGDMHRSGYQRTLMERIADALLEAHAAGARAGAEMAAKLIDSHAIRYGSPSDLVKRSEGDRNGLDYAAAIRAMIPHKLGKGSADE